MLEPEQPVLCQTGLECANELLKPGLSMAAKLELFFWGKKLKHPKGINRINLVFPNLKFTVVTDGMVGKREMFN